MSKRTLRTLLSSTVCVLIAAISLNAMALDSDSDQAATLDADDFDLDLKNSIRTYRGNVVYQQGSIRMECDELVTYFNADGELNQGVCKGRPGTFKQRPEGSNSDLLGSARTITYDQTNAVVILETRAEVIQGSDTMTSKQFTYDLNTEKITATGVSKVTEDDTDADDTSEDDADADDASEEDANADDASEDDADADDTNAEDKARTPIRPSLTIQPRKKEQN